LRVFRSTIVLLALAGSALAQQHTVSVNIPSVLSVSIDATNVLFDFSASPATSSLTVGGTSYPRAALDNYTAFLDSGAASRVFAATNVSLGAGSADWVTLTVRSNRAQWTVSVAPATGSALAAPLSNSRVRVYSEKITGAGASQTATPTALPATGGLPLAQATTAGQGKSRYKVYHLLEMNLSDDIPLSGYSSSVTLVYTIASP